MKHYSQTVKLISVIEFLEVTLNFVRASAKHKKEYAIRTVFIVLFHMRNQFPTKLELSY